MKMSMEEYMSYLQQLKQNRTEEKTVRIARKNNKTTVQKRIPKTFRKR
jgi:hypothetical protein